ncbi:glycoside hydrolase family 5 protein [Sorangium cellulosum]|uniref:glycoside hydrolase family 5 protein n=1 Tax=Sorangium cellulosum TaxID=56 RepID=UPI001F5CF888|nr:glycoside hydrolase family 5 protein [Sorangium cellulosum]
MSGEEGVMEPTDEGSFAASSRPVDTHGALQIVGNQLRDQHGRQVQLKGMSLFWSQWAGSFYNASVVNTIADGWGATVVRAAMAVESGGYLTNPTAEKEKVRTVVRAAVDKGIYVIIDWHDHSATDHKDQAKAFFTEMAREYKNTPNVIFEIFNEPDNEPWSRIKPYAIEVIDAIRAQGANNVIVVGTPTWSQDVDVAASDPITGRSNIAYTLHFYANTHRESLRRKAQTALDRGLALFVTEFGTCDASGNGGLNLSESQTWMSWLDTRKISWANWSLFDKDETASALRPGAGPGGNWPDSSLTESGRWVKSKILEGSGSSGAGGSGGGGGTGGSGGGGTGGSGGGGTTSNFQFTVSPNINNWWIQVKVVPPSGRLTDVGSVKAQVGSSSYDLQYQSWGEWAISRHVPAGTVVRFTARTTASATPPNTEATYASAPWPSR